MLFRNAGSTPAISTRNCNFLRQVPGNCSDKEPYFLPDYQGNTAFAFFDRDAGRDDIPGKNRHFLSEISLTHGTSFRDNLPFFLRIKFRRDKQTTPIFGRTQTTIPFEREIKIPEKTFLSLKDTDGILSCNLKKQDKG